MRDHPRATRRLRGSPRKLAEARQGRRRDLEQSWEYFQRRDLHKLSAVDATSFVIMKRARIRLAFTFNHHFSIVGFRPVA
jgi:predicted nucleic acid-binding protein